MFHLEDVASLGNDQDQDDVSLHPLLHHSIIPLGLFIPSPLCALCVLCG